MGLTKPTVCYRLHQVAGCQERSVTINTCLGVCLSFSTPTGANYKQVESCTCCRQIKTEKVDVGLWCQDKADPSNLVKYFHPIETATECACASCWYSWLKRPCKSMNAQRFYETSGYWSCQNFFFSLKWRRVWTRHLKLKLSKNKTKQNKKNPVSWNDCSYMTFAATAKFSRPARLKWKRHNFLYIIVIHL